ncbi:MAG: hypothetical protein WCD20_21450 [Rhodomicrobium sp.]
MNEIELSDSAAIYRKRVENRIAEIKSAAAEDIRRLASLVEACCAENVIKFSASVSDERGMLAIDQLIEQHINELHDDEMTRLPQDRAMHIKVLDRLQQRKVRRAKRELYAFASEETLADLVLKLLDEEIGDEDKAQLA